MIVKISSQGRAKTRLRYPRIYLNTARDPSHHSVTLPTIHDVGYYYYEDSAGRNYEQAFLWFSKGADLGDEKCMYGLGAMYLYGDYVKNNDERSLYWLHRAAAMNHLDAIELLFDIHFDKSYRLFDLALAKKWAEHGAEIDKEKSTFMVMQGRIWLEKGNYSKARHFFLQAEAAQDGAEGSYYLGLMLQKSCPHGERSNSARSDAAAYFMKASVAGHEEATKRLREQLRIERVSPLFFPRLVEVSV
jgi:TPR repeat protein